MAALAVICVGSLTGPYQDRQIGLANVRLPTGNSELPKKETWEWIAAQLREHGLPKRGLPKKGSVDTDFGRLADALLIRTERTIAKLELNDR